MQSQDDNKQFFPKGELWGECLSELFFRLRNVKKAYGKHLVLSGVNLDVYKGEILGIIGTSGSGKTTLLHAMIGFLKPDKGEISILIEPSHRALGEATYSEVHKNLNVVKNMYGFASQAPSFYDDLTVVENLKYFGSLYDMPRHTIETNMQILLHLMDLDLAAKSKGKNLSGGMERRLDIACALMHDPAVLILDEPTADLDPVLRMHIYDLIKKINAKDTTIVLASHHLADLERVCDRIAILKEGKILAIGSLDEIKKQFSDYSLVQIKLVNKHYRELAEEMRHHKDLFVKVESFSSGMVFYTNKPQECARNIMHCARKLHDKVDDLHIGKPSLDDIFIAIMAQEMKDKEAKRKKISGKKGEEKKAEKEEKEIEQEEKQEVNKSKDDESLKEKEEKVERKVASHSHHIHHDHKIVKNEHTEKESAASEKKAEDEHKKQSEEKSSDGKNKSASTHKKFVVHKKKKKLQSFFSRRKTKPNDEEDVTQLLEDKLVEQESKKELEGGEE
jgi:ABC-2 type transport system ATP-binding protein